MTSATRRWTSHNWIDYTGNLITDGDHDSEQSDRVFCIDGRPRGRRALLTEFLLFLAKRHRPPTPPPIPSFPSSLAAPLRVRPPRPPPRRLSNIVSGRRWGADAGSLIAHSYAVAVAGGRRRGGEATATAGKRVWDGRARRWRRGGEAVATGGRGRGDGRQVGGDGRARRGHGGASVAG